MIVYLTEQGARVVKSRGCLEVRKGREVLQVLRLFELEQLVLYGKIQLSTDALRSLIASGVDTVLLAQTGRFLGRLSGGLGKNVLLRRDQHRRCDDPAFALALSRLYVSGKLKNSMALLRRHNRVLRDDEVGREAVAIRRLIPRIDEATDLDELRGFEGAGSARYFAALRSIFRAPGMSFFRRARRPPPDPVNILLSLGYTLLGNLVHGLCEMAGLDPYVGTLHSLEYGRPSLALDLIEEFRPVLVDSTALRAVNTRAIGPRDFERAEEPIADAEDELWRATDRAREPGDEQDEAHEAEPESPPRQVLLLPSGLKKWFFAFERRLEERVYYAPSDLNLSYRQVLREQVYALARHIQGEGDYQPFAYR